MKITPAQFATLHTLAEFGPKTAIEVCQPPAMDGTRKVKLQWNVASGPTLAALEGAQLVHVTRETIETVRNAVGKPGLQRRRLMITITDAGREALAAN